MTRQDFTDSLARVIDYGLVCRDEGHRARQADRSGVCDAGGRKAHGAGRQSARDSIRADVSFLLSATEAEERSILYRTAAGIRDAECGRRLAVRGLVEFSSRCANTCLYCGLNRDNGKAERYQLGPEEILESARLVAEAGIRTIVLQSGEDSYSAAKLAAVIREIKARFDLAVTLSVGERPRADFALWREAGADRYLLRVEASDAALYASMHRGRELSTRLRCLADLRELGYQVGSGIMVGPPGQTRDHVAGDILFFSDSDFDMIGIGPFIPHPDTPFAAEPAGSVELTLNAVALARIVTRNAWIPATTALGSMDRDYRADALRAGANVLMPNFSPVGVKAKYRIYPGKRCVTENTGACASCTAGIARQGGLDVDLSRADSLKPRFAAPGG